MSAGNNFEYKVRYQYTDLNRWYERGTYDSLDEAWDQFVVVRDSIQSGHGVFDVAEMQTRPKVHPWRTTVAVGRIVTE